MNNQIKNPSFQNPSHVQLKGPAALPLPQERPVEVRTYSRGTIDGRSGADVKLIGQKTVGHKALGDRRSARQQRRSAVKEKSGSQVSDLAGLDNEEEDEEGSFPYRQAARSTLELLLENNSSKGREEIEEALSKTYEPLQEFTILFGAIKELEKREDKTPRQKRVLKESINELMTSLVHRERSGFRKGLREAAETSPVAATLEAALKQRGFKGTLRELRFGLGQKPGVEEDLPPYLVGRAVLKNFGTAHAEEGANQIGARLADFLRVDSRMKVAAYALAAADLRAISHFRTGVKVARDLKRNTVAKADKLSPLHPTEMGTVMLTVAHQGWGKGKGMQVVNQLMGDMKHESPLTRAKVYTEVRDAFDLLPITSWPPEKLPARKELLEDLDHLVFEAHAEMPPKTTKEERREEEWRNMFAAGRKPTELPQEENLPTYEQATEKPPSYEQATGKPPSYEQATGKTGASGQSMTQVPISDKLAAQLGMPAQPPLQSPLPEKGSGRPQTGNTPIKTSEKAGAQPLGVPAARPVSVRS